MTRREHLRSDDGGWAMVVVLATTMVLSLLVGIALTSATTALGTSRRTQDSLAALAAAQAGVQDYVQQLNRDPLYFQRLAPATPHAADPGGVDLANPALRRDATAESPPARVVRLSDGSEQSYRYQVLSTRAETEETGRVRLLSVGRSRAEQRTVRVTLSNESIFKYLYYAEFETGPPVVQGSDPVACAALSHDQHGTTPRPPGCGDVLFQNGDDILGPVHTEDRLQIRSEPPSAANGNQQPPRFRGPVETGWLDPSGRGYVASGTAAPVFDQGTPVHVDVPFPKYNTELREQAVAGNGCLYQGPTRILFHAGGTMTVSTVPGPVAPRASCGTFSSENLWTATVPVPDNGVVWVDKSTSSTCTVDEQRARIGFPVADDTALIGGTTSLFHNCVAGTVFVEGWVRGQTTVAAEDSVFVTGNLRHVGDGGRAVGTPLGTIAEDSSGSDSLGLYADRGYVAAYHPIACTARGTDPKVLDPTICTGGGDVSRPGDPVSTSRPSIPTTYPMTGLQIDAAIVAPQAFLLPNVGLGAPKGRLVVLGAIIQRFRGVVSGLTAQGQLLKGFRKEYHYDRRLRSAPPPYLADGTTTAWGVDQFAEGPG